MSISLPSIPIYITDVPEIEEANVAFQYNFFTADESLNSNGSFDSTLQKISALESNEEFVKSQTTKMPRVNLIQFKLPTLKFDDAFDVSEQNGSLIYDNIENVITEQEFANGHYIGLTFTDSQLDENIFYMLSGSINMRSTFDLPPASTLSQKVSNTFKKENISKSFIAKSLNKKSDLNGTRHFDKQGKRIFDSYSRSLKSVHANMQISSRLIDDICDKTLVSPLSNNQKDLSQAKKEIQKLPIEKKLSSFIREEDYRTVLKYIDVLKLNNTTKDKFTGKIVGYIIDKAEILDDGGFVQHDPIVIDDPKVNFTADFKIKYNSTYSYSIRTVVLFNLPAIDEESNEIGVCKILVSSKPSANYYVRTTEIVSPPPPSNLNFTWDYERVNPLTAEFDIHTNNINLATGIPGSLMVSWTFPNNSQRDIKKFQVFRRENIHHPFELIKMYNFDDSQIKIDDLENPSEEVLEIITSPCNYYFDDEFKKESKYIYSICAIDAHGLTSGYSEQFEVWFDEYTNKIQKRLISHSGAPKSYPNLYLERDLFKDTIRLSGEQTKRLKVYFTPELYQTFDDFGKKENIVINTAENGKYILSAINLDNQKSVSLSINIHDYTKKKNLTNQKRVLFKNRASK
jgi:hypothetical protein